MGINKVQYGNTTLIDLTSDTVTADKLMQGYTAHDRSGTLITGTATGGGGSGGNVWQDQDGYVHLDDEGTTPITVEPLSVTQNGTYTAPTGKAYSPVTVNVSGGGGLVYETGTWTPTEDVESEWISFTNSHNEEPIFVMIEDSDISTVTAGSWTVCCINVWGNFYGATGTIVAASARRYFSGTNHNTGSGTIASSSLGSWVTSSAFRPNGTYTGNYWRSTRTYKWIAVWAPTT